MARENISTTVSMPFVHELSTERLEQLQAATAKRLSLCRYFHDELQGGSPGPELAVIPAGIYEMGSDRREFGHTVEESPQHYRHIRKSFALCRFAITAEQFSLYEQSVGWQWRPELVHVQGQYPVINVTAVQASEYALWLSEQTGHRYRLPSEAEWEYAARSGSLTAFCFGNNVNCRQVHFNPSFPLQNHKDKKLKWPFPKCIPRSKSRMVGSMPANLWGLHEMHGNVWELTTSRWRDAHTTQVDPVVFNPDDLPQWVVTKGGSWFDAAVKARSAARMPRMRDELDINLGIRLLREVE